VCCFCLVAGCVVVHDYDCVSICKVITAASHYLQQQSQSTACSLHSPQATSLTPSAERCVQQTSSVCFQAHSSASCFLCWGGGSRLCKGQPSCIAVACDMQKSCVVLYAGVVRCLPLVTMQKGSARPAACRALGGATRCSANC
jgi:hypothetical protein